MLGGWGGGAAGGKAQIWRSLVLMAARLQCVSLLTYCRSGCHCQSSYHCQSGCWLCSRGLVPQSRPGTLAVVGSPLCLCVPVWERPPCLTSWLPPTPTTFTTAACPPAGLSGPVRAASATQTAMRSACSIHIHACTLARAPGPERLEQRTVVCASFPSSASSSPPPPSCTCMVVHSPQ